MKNLPSILLTIGLALFATSPFILAQEAEELDIPRTISYQGVLTASEGSVVPDGTYDISIGLYTDPQGHEQIWLDTYNTLVHNGIFNIYLGTGTSPLPSTSEMNRPLWIGTSINGSDIMRPLTPLTASPYALNLPDQTVTTNKLADNAVTAQKVDMPYIAAIEVNGIPITGKGSTLNIETKGGLDLIYDETRSSLVLGLPENPYRLKLTDEKGTNILSGGLGNWVEVPTPGVIHDPAGGSSNYNTISGGQNHNIGQTTPTAIFVDYGTISGGELNTVLSDHGTISGGESNTVSNVNGTISGGSENTVSGSHGAIGGGTNNSVAGNLGFIGGGEDNSSTNGSWTVIGGGNQNVISAASAGAANLSMIGGGGENTIDAQYAVITGGWSNQINSYNATIGGGRLNEIHSGTGTIAGGHHNVILGANTAMPAVEAFESSIGGGRDNEIGAGAYQSTIGGGAGNGIGTDASGATIGGGVNNDIIAAPATTSGTITSRATIPGGEFLIANSWAQTVLGAWNLQKGAVPFRYNTSAPIPSQTNHPILIIGNGWQETERSNAFEVSYNGHSVVYDQNGTGGATGTGRAAIRGATYTDNTILAWATANPLIGSQTIGTPITVTCDFGVASITRLGLGHFRVLMNLDKPLDDGTFTPMNLDCGSVTISPVYIFHATKLTSPPCATISTTPITGNTFDVYIKDNTVCDFRDLPFTFKVTGRPE